MSAPKGDGLDAANDQPAKTLTKHDTDFTGFAGTCNVRHLRALRALMSASRTREELDQIAGCSNGPALVAELRRRGLEVPCLRKRKINRDGIDTLPGTYYFTELYQSRQRKNQSQ